MVFFEMLIGASVKAVKDFISHCYSRLKSIYYSFKRWLLEISGQFKAHDAFVNMCFGHIADIEDFEAELAEEYAEKEEEIEEARSLLRLLTAQKSKSGVDEAWTDFFLKSRGGVYAPLNCEPKSIELDAKADKLEKLLEDMHLFEVRAAKTYIKEKGRGFINCWNDLRSRLQLVKSVKDEAKDNIKAASKIGVEFSAPTNIADLYTFTEVTKVETGLTKETTRVVNGEEETSTVPLVEDVRKIKDDEVSRESASNWIREVIKLKNSTLSADELSLATIARYVENLGEKYKLDIASKTYLKQCAMISVPIPSQKDIKTKMVIQSPAARALRERVAVLDSQGFLEGLCTASGFESPFTILGLPEIAVTDGARLRKVSSNINYLTQTHLGLVYKAPNASLHNALVAIERRVFTVGKGDSAIYPPHPEYDIFSETMGYFAESIVNKVGYCKTYTPQQLALSYSAGKRAQYFKAIESLKKEPYQMKDSNVQAFLKKEKHWMTKAIAPRLICPRSKRYNIILGTRLKFNEKKIMHAIDGMFGSPTVLSGYDSFTQGSIIASKWQKFASPVAIGVDASRFDQHVSEQALKWEHGIYNGIFGDNELALALEHQLVNNIKMFVEDKMLTFKVRGHRMSGDINTSMGNKLIMCGMMHAYFKKLGVEAELCNNGDDCVIITERANEHLFGGMYDHFLKYGFNMVTETPVYELGELEFCQSKPVRIGGNYRMVRRPDCIGKDSNTLLSMRNESDVKSYMSAVAQCGLVLNAGVPILESFYRCLYRSSGYKKVSEEYIKNVISYGTDERLQGRRTFEETPITTDNRMSYWESFGVDPKIQQLVERYYDNLTVSAQLQSVKVTSPHLQSILLSIPENNSHNEY
uniref:RNA-directed RNA polymerase n=1 Tax=Barley yellow dwarf virus (isolate PAV) TaxID=2169986 RepID=A0A7R7TCG1_BYDVP|nr:RNA-dependent RNA polymerase P1-P2 fusion protein [Barley yellow dwarf virus PAV]